MEKAEIGINYDQQPAWKQILAIPFVYLPIIFTIPFVIIGVTLVRIHLSWVGGMKLKKYSDFIPTWASHRYTHETQIVFPSKTFFGMIMRSKYFWIFNCKIYCPLSVGLMRYAAYLVTIIENWWCPFNHDLKKHYSIGAIDESFWHITPERMALLNPEDRENPIWHTHTGSHHSN